MSSYMEHPVMMAGMSQKMATLLAISCPPNYNCGGPSYAALAALDSILNLMGIGVAMVQRRGHSDMSEYEAEVRKNAVTKESPLEGYLQHKGQILSGAVHCILTDLRSGNFREGDAVTEGAMLSIMEWYLKKAGTSPEKFLEKLKAGGHDELTQLEANAKKKEEEGKAA